MQRKFNARSVFLSPPSVAHPVPTIESVRSRRGQPASSLDPDVSFTKQLFRP